MNRMYFHLFDLPMDDLYIDLQPNFRNRIFNECLRKFNSWINFANTIKEKPRNVVRWKNGIRAPNIEVLYKITKLGISSEKEIEKNIKKIKRSNGFIRNPRLPLELNEDLAKIIAATFCDGGINKDNGVHYTNKNLNHFISFKKAVKNVFGDVHIIVDYKRKSTGVYHIVYSGVMGIILNKTFDVPKRSKIFLDSPIPKFIMQADNKILKSFIRQCYDDEGWISKDIGMSRSIIKKELKSTDGPIFLLDLKYILQNKFGIKVHGPRLNKNRFYIRNGKNTYVGDYWLKVCDRKSLELFYKNIGFSLDYKMKRLRNKISSYKMLQTPNGESLNFFLREAVRHILNEGKPFSVGNLVYLTNRTSSRVNWAIQNLRKNKLIKKVGYERDRINRDSLPIYTVTNKGVDMVFNFGNF